MMSSAGPFDLKPTERPLQPAPIETGRSTARWMRFRWFDLQWGHRVGTVALFVFLAAIACAIADEGPYGLLLGAAVILADIGLIGAVMAWWTTRRLGQRSRESLALIIFNLVVLALAVGCYIAGKFDYLNPAIQWIINLFPPVS